MKDASTLRNKTKYSSRIHNDETENKIPNLDREVT